MTKYSAVGAIHDLLGREYEALMSGRLEELPDITDQKEKVFSKVATLELSASEMESLLRLSKRNAGLIAAAHRAIHEARQFLLHAESAVQTHAYSADGARVALHAGHRTLGQKA